MKCLALVVMAAAGIATMGCAAKADSPSTLRISGSVGQQSSALGGARAIATSSDGRSFSAQLTKTGAFAIDVPVGATYRLVIANPTRTGQLRIIGHLVSPTTHGTTDAISVKDAGTLALGALRPAGTSVLASGAASTAGTVQTKSAGDSAEHEGDTAEHEDGSETEAGEGKESEDDGKLCQDGDDVELDAEHAPGPEHEASSDAAKPAASGKSCDVHDTDHDGADD